MSQSRLLRSPAFDGRHTDVEGSRDLGEGHPTIEGCQRPDTQVLGVSFHASHATTRSMFLHFAIEREAQRTIELMWLLKKLTPDFKTIADFRKDNLLPLQQACRTFTLLCKEFDLFGGELVAIDGSKFKAVNNRKRNFTPEKLTKALEHSDAKIAEYLQALDTADSETPTRPALTAAELQQR
jgi:hypothetical protein